MICLSVAENTEATIYLDVHHIEKKSRNPETFAVSGTLGDGLYEGEVLLEVSDAVEVTFADSWLDWHSLLSFFERNGKEEICEALRETAGSMIFCLENFPAAENAPREKVVAYEAAGKSLPLRPRHYGEQMELPMKVAEKHAFWRAVA